MVLLRARLKLLIGEKLLSAMTRQPDGLSKARLTLTPDTFFHDALQLLVHCIDTPNHSSITHPKGHSTDPL